MRTIIATKNDKSVRFHESENEIIIRAKNMSIDEIQVLMDNDVHNGCEYDGWSVNFD